MHISTGARYVLMIVYRRVGAQLILREDPVTIPLCTVQKASAGKDVILTDYIRDFVPILLYMSLMSLITYHESSEKYGKM